MAAAVAPIPRARDPWRSVPPPDGADAPPAPEALASALSTVWSAVHHHAAVVRAGTGNMPPREVIDAWCDCASAFDALKTVAEFLAAEPRTVGEAEGPVPARPRR